MDYSNKVFEYLRNNKTKVTRHIEVVIDFIIQQSTPIDAKTIYEKCTSNNYEINLSTIHRILYRLQKIGVLDIIYGEKSTYYELSAQFLPHHHHFTCIKCGKITDIDICMLTPILKSIYNIGTPVSHSFEIKGICNFCK